MASVLATNLLVFIPPILGVLWAFKEVTHVSLIKLTGPPSGIQASLMGNGQKVDVPKILERMRDISSHIAEGANAFLISEYKYMLVYVIVFSIIIGPSIGLGTMIAFIVGSLTSIACGYIGMRTAVYCNVRTSHESWKNISAGYDVAIRGGSVMGFALVSLGVFNLFILALIYSKFYGDDVNGLYEALTGYGLGGSSIALFGRVGGGIYTKAADVGADLSGKNEYGLDEDDPRNPGCIADNVGDNVGDIAGMGADLFGSFAESTCAAMVICSAAPEVAVHGSWSSMMFPLLLSSVGIIVGIVTMMCVDAFYKVQEIKDVERSLKGILVISTSIQTPMVILLAWWALPSGLFAIDASRLHCTWWKCAICVLLGLWSGLCIGNITEYFTSDTYRPVRGIAKAEGISAATGIIIGLASGYASTVIPTLCLGLTICVAFSLAGMFGVALGALGMLGTLTMSLTIDAYGPISDNAGGIAEMSGMGPEVRELTDALDSAGNTTAAIGKGFAIGSAALVSLALFGAYTVRAGVHIVSLLDPWTFTGLLFGAMMPYAFSAMTMKSVGKAANQMVEECMSQFPKIISGEMKPNYTKCIKIATDASLMEMIAPGCLVILSPLVAGLIFGKNCTAGLLCGALVSGVQLAISMSNTGSSWDNAKKYIEAGGLGPECGKGSQAHKNAVTGDTIGDPLKDTSGPAINIVIKLSAIMSLVFGGVIAKTSNEHGGPFWLK